MWNRQSEESVVNHASFLAPVSQPHMEQTRNVVHAKSTPNKASWCDYSMTAFIFGSDIHFNPLTLNSGSVQKAIGVRKPMSASSGELLPKCGHEVSDTLNLWGFQNRRLFNSCEFSCCPQKSFLNCPGNLDTLQGHLPLYTDRPVNRIPWCAGNAIHNVLYIF